MDCNTEIESDNYIALVNICKFHMSQAMWSRAQDHPDAQEWFSGYLNGKLTPGGSITFRYTILKNRKHLPRIMCSVQLAASASATIQNILLYKGEEADVHLNKIREEWYDKQCGVVITALKGQTLGKQ
jgi:hypothetical protein